MNKVRLCPVSWLLRALALLVLATFPVWWVAAWRCERPRPGFWGSGWDLLRCCLEELVFGD